MASTVSKSLERLAGGLGFEPRLAESESAVLPLDDPPSDAQLESGPIARWIDSTTRRRTVGLSVTVLPGSCLPRVTPPIAEIPLQHRVVLGAAGGHDGW